jgi:hypothetical protein
MQVFQGSTQTKKLLDKPGTGISGAWGEPIKLAPLYNHMKVILNILYNKNYLIVILVGKTCPMGFMTLSLYYYKSNPL